MEDNSESGTRLQDSQVKKYESAYKLLSSQSRQERIEGILYHPSDCTATRVDIVADQLWRGGLLLKVVKVGKERYLHKQMRIPRIDK